MGVTCAALTSLQPRVPSCLPLVGFPNFSDFQTLDGGGRSPALTPLLRSVGFKRRLRSVSTSKPVDT